MTPFAAAGEAGWPRKTVAMAVWFLLAIVVFNVRFDWQARAANHAFVRSQIVRHQQGQPTLTINDAFRPMVRQAAIDGSVWLVSIASLGVVLTAVAARRTGLDA
ncbi:MAG: hypothetical protein K2Y23_13785 [Cyanobacteria bacterium]|nr:hypothetical protein [Cyanobacteriota bacterium]